MRASISVFAAALVLAVTAACHTTHTTESPTRARLDSLDYSRGPCYGSCPQFSLQLRRDGRVDISSARGVHRFAISSARADSILADASNAGLLLLPTNIRADSTLCPVVASDHSTISLTGFAYGQGWLVAHYAGCYTSAPQLTVATPLVPLVRLEARLDGLVRELMDRAQR